MATIKTIEFHCPHCNKKLRSTPYGDYACIGKKLYGSPRQVCPKCKKTYINPQLTEPALELTLAQRAPLLMTGTRTIVAETILLVFCVVFAFYGAPELLAGVPVVALFHLLLSLATRPYRQNHKNRVLAESRTRLKEDVQYFVETLARTPMYSVDKGRLTPVELGMIHKLACDQMDRDNPLRLETIVRDVQLRGVRAF